MALESGRTTGQQLTEEEWILSVVADEINSAITTVPDVIQAALDDVQSSADSAAAAANAAALAASDAMDAAEDAQDSADAAQAALEGTQTGGGAAQYVFSSALPATVDGTYNFTVAAKATRSQNYRIIRMFVFTHSGLGSNAGSQNTVLRKGDGAGSEAFTTITDNLNLASVGNNALSELVPDGGGNMSTDTGDHYFPYTVIESGKSLVARVTVAGRTNGLTTRAYVHVLTSPEPIP